MKIRQHIGLPIVWLIKEANLGSMQVSFNIFRTFNIVNFNICFNTTVFSRYGSQVQNIIQRQILKSLA